MANKKDNGDKTIQAAKYVKHNSLFKLLYGLYKAKIPTMIWSKPGLGKTRTVEKLGSVLKVPTVTVSGNKCDPVDFSGIPYLVDGECEIAVPKYVQQLKGEIEQSERMTREVYKALRDMDIPVNDDDEEAELPFEVLREKITEALAKEFKEALKKDPKFKVEPRRIKTLIYETLEAQKKLQEKKEGILFLDEINTCPAQIQAALLSIVQDGNYNGFKLPNGIYRVAAGNYQDTLGNHAMSQALANRMVHIFVEPDAEGWCEGFISGFANYEKPIVNTRDEWLRRLVKYKVAMTNFIHQNPTAFYVDKEELINKEDVAFATPRTLELACEIMAWLDQNDEDYIFELMCGILGTDVAPLFINFLNDYEGLGIDLPTLVGHEEDLKLPKPKKHDQVKQIMASLVFYLNEDPKKYYKLWGQMLNVLYNKDRKYGDYDGYATLIAMYIRQNVDTFLDAGVMKVSDIKNNADKIDCWNDIMSLIVA